MFAFQRRLGFSLLSFFVAVSVLPLLIIWLISSTQFAIQSEEQIQNQISSIADIRVTQIDTLVVGAETTLNQTLSDGAILNRLVTVLTVEGDWGSVIELLSSNLTTEQQTQNTFEEIFIFDLEGEVSVATDSTRLQENVLGQVFYESSLAGQMIHPITLENGEFQMILTRPIFDREDVIVGVMAGQVYPDIIYQILDGETGLGSTASTYLIQVDNQQLLTPANSVALSEIATTTQMDSDGILLGIEQSTGISQYNSAFDNEVIGAYRLLDDLDTLLLTEVSVEEALRTVRSLNQTIAIVTIIAGLISVGIGFLVTRSLTNPILRLTTVANSVIDGDL